ncbi:MAG: helix-turn-helix domain-containing protein [Firmicutes bacterium]|nr:helix-turn-helix domain-containing protein [Bacillota bacterium]
MEKKNTNIFGGFIRLRREALGKSLRGMAADLGIAAPYLSDMENDKRYPPTGDLLKRMEELLCKGNPELQYYFNEAAGFGRDDLPPDMVEHLKSHFSTRLLVRLLMQVDLRPETSTDEENYHHAIQKAIEGVASQKGIKLIYPE